MGAPAQPHAEGTGLPLPQAPAPVSFDPVQLEIDAWGENRRITRCVQLIGARMRFMQSSMDEFTASMGEVTHQFGAEAEQLLHACRIW